MQIFKTMKCEDCGRQVRAELLMGMRELLDGYHGICPICGCRYWPVHNAENTEKVLIHDEAPTEVHLVGGNFISAEKTLCGERLHSICSVHIVNDNIPVTCEKCNNLAGVS